MFQTARPGEDTGNGVGAGGVALATRTQSDTDVIELQPLGNNRLQMCLHHGLTETDSAEDFHSHEKYQLLHKSRNLCTYKTRILFVQMSLLLVWGLFFIFVCWLVFVSIVVLFCEDFQMHITLCTAAHQRNVLFTKMSLVLL